MTSVVAGGLFNAVAFAGAGFLFSKLNHRGYEDEIKRHNEAVEKLAKAKEAWYEREVERKNKMEELRLKLSDANHDFDETNRALKVLQNAMKVDVQPTIHDYYEPSDEMKHYQRATIGTLGLGIGAGLAGLIKYWL